MGMWEVLMCGEDDDAALPITWADAPARASRKQRHVRIRLDVARLARPERRAEEQCVVLQALQVDGPGRGSAVGAEATKATDPGCARPALRASSIHSRSSSSGLASASAMP